MPFRRKPKRQKKAVPAEPPKSREELEALYGEVWDTAQLARDFIVTSIISPHVVVRRKADDAIGTVQFQSGPPCLYFNFTPQPKDQ